MGKTNDYVAAWPYNIIDEILGNSYEGTPYEGIVTNDQIKALEFVINKRLDSRQRDMLLLHFRDGLTLKTIGEKYALTSSRVRYIVKYACRILRHPSSKNLVLQGYYRSRILEEENNLRAKEQALQVRKKTLEEQEELVRQMEEQLRAKHPEIMDPIDRKAELAATEIKVLNLSARPYNALKAHMLYTIQDLVDYMGNRNLEDIEGIGIKSAEEIQNKLHAFLIQM